jgi:hypothetical protein
MSTEKSKDSIDLRTPQREFHSRKLLSDFQIKLLELTELANEMGKDHALIAKGIQCSSTVKTKELAKGRVQILFTLKATLPPIKAEVTF